MALTTVSLSLTHYNINIHSPVHDEIRRQAYIGSEKGITLIGVLGTYNHIFIFLYTVVLPKVVTIILCYN